MLITNFASGELSETLFGRTDIPQYYSGASRVENFDVIPTGGLKKRGGTERLLKLNEGEGRIIPFVVNRNLSFILFFTPGKITVYKIENGAINVLPVIFLSGNGLQLFEYLSEIRDVQYAQSFDTMILCHCNYPPLEVKLNTNNIVITKLQIKYNVPVICGNGINDNEKQEYSKNDELYKDNHWLASQGNYPAAVSFFNGRLVFAGTKNNPQRIFASAVKETGNNYNFSTKKIFLTPKEEYLVIRGTVAGNGNTITVKDKETPLSFTKDLASYEIKNKPFFPEGTKILRIYGEVIELTKNSTINYGLTEGDFAVINTWRNNANNEINSYPVYKLNVNFPIYTRYFYLNPRINILRIYNSTMPTLELFLQNNQDSGYDKTITDSFAISVIQANAADGRNLVKEFIISKCEEFVSYGITQDEQFGQLSERLYSQIINYRQYTFRGITYYGTSDSIYQQIINYYDQGTDVYIPFFTREIIVDEYPTPDCGFTFEIASDMNDAIKWLAVNKGLITGTETAEWIIPPGIHATNVQAVLNSRYGSDKIQGTAIGDAACFFQTGKKALVEYYIPQQDNNFRANNMALTSDNMLRESPAKEFDFISSPYTKLFITREDGQAVTLLYERSTGTFAWSRITTEGKILSACALPAKDGYDEMYLLVKRADKIFLEVLRENSDVYLDSYVKVPVSLSEYEIGATTYNGYVGYPYTSRVRSMPIIANNKMKPNNIKNILIRFLDSYMPDIKALPNNKTDIIPCNEPYSGVYKTAFPGTWDIDVMFELIHNKPSRCKILAINAEVN